MFIMQDARRMQLEIVLTKASGRQVFLAATNNDVIIYFIYFNYTIFRAFKAY